MTRPERVYNGKSVENGKFRYSSVTQIKLFDPHAEGCNRKWWFQYVGGKKLAKTDVLIKGADLDEKLEHYLGTGEDVLPPVLQPAKNLFPEPGPDLELQKPLGPDFPAAVRLRDEILRGNHFQEALSIKVKQLAGLTIRGVPFDGAPDVRHFRTEYIDDDGLPQKDPPGAIVVKIDDLKTTLRIWPQKILSGPNAGTILPSYAKTAAQVCADSQMLVYARRDCDVFPDATHFRLGHVYANTKKREASRRSGIISREEVLRRFTRIENVFDEMIQVATATRVEDVKPSPSSCDNYTHVGPDGKTARGCGHRYYCPLSDSAIVQNMLGNYKETAMSLFDTLKPTDLPLSNSHSPAIQAHVPPPPVDLSAERAAIELEKQKLLAQDAAGRVQKFGCGAIGCGDGCAPGYVRGTESPGAFLICKNCQGKGGITIRMEDAPAPPPPAAPNAIIPPDAPPPPSLFHAAAPLPVEERERITDPALKKVVEEHAAAHAAAAQAEEAASGVWCPASNTMIALTMEMALSRKYACTCGKEHKLKPEKKEDGTFVATLGRHKPPKTEKVEEVVAAAPPPPPAPERTIAPTVPNGNGHNGTHLIEVLAWPGREGLVQAHQKAFELEKYLRLAIASGDELAKARATQS